ncbi:hypothetical protein ACG7TL_007166 [Trametes sanguinea]
MFVSTGWQIQRRWEHSWAVLAALLEASGVRPPAICIRIMIPKHANPLLLPDQTVVVSRAALRDADDEGENDGDGADPERAQMLARLENILKRSIAAVLPSEPSHAAGRDGENARKKKRRKTEPSKDEEREGEGKGEEPVAVPFRLLSGVTQPKPIVLAPKPPPVYKSIRPQREDTEAEAARRAARAREVAVDFAWVLKESGKPYVPLPNAAKKERAVTAHFPSASPPLLLLEVSKPAPKPPHPARLDPTIPVEPSPHAHETSPSCCPIVPASPGPSPATSSLSSTTAADSEPKERKRKRRRNKAKAEKPPVQPAFWRPREGMGGKSAGYALGYPGWPLREGDVPRYHRDTMRTAVFVFDA